MSRITEIRVAGFGGQGVILSASVLGKAGSVFEGGFATMCQAFGPEARGGACSAQLILSNEPILYPYVTCPDILVVMSQEAYTKFEPDLKDDGVLIVERDLVRISHVNAGQKLYSVPATRLAEELGKRMVLNIVMVGFFAAVANLMNPESVRKAVEDSVPESFKDLNLRAFDKGFEYGEQRLAQFADGESVQEMAAETMESA